MRKRLLRDFWRSAIGLVVTMACAGVSPAPAASIALASHHGEKSAATRIVTLAPHLTELVYAAGAGDRLVGVESHSDYPADAKKLPAIGDAFQVDYERVLALQPDLVLVWNTGTPEPIIERLKRLGLPVQRVTISTLADIASAIRNIGAWAGTGSAADAAAQRYVQEISDLRRERAHAAPLSVFYQISEKPLYTVNGRHLISEVIALCGGSNIFAELAQLAPPVGVEAVVERDPDVILTGDSAQGDPLSVWRTWTQMRAVRHGNLYTLNADYVARSTPRVVLGVRQVCAVLDRTRSKKGQKSPIPS